ncbi:MAG TPA: hypothetical protein VFT75_18430 [Nocardioidaceae bacterium]|nr:hypothetical protein [Nocardioidaceae bacterium]
MQPIQRRPPSREQGITNLPGLVSLWVEQQRRWEQTRPGVLTPVADGEPKIQLMAGDYCTGPESFTVQEAMQLRDALGEAVRAAAAWAEEQEGP